MARIRLNQEYRNKIANRIKQHLFQEDTQEKRKYDDLKADQININDNAPELCRYRGQLQKKLFVGIIQMKMLKKHIIFKISLKMFQLLQKTVAFIFIIKVKLKVEIMTTIQ